MPGLTGSIICLYVYRTTISEQIRTLTIKLNVREFLLLLFWGWSKCTRSITSNVKVDEARQRLILSRQVNSNCVKGKKTGSVARSVLESVENGALTKLTNQVDRE